MYFLYMYIRLNSVVLVMSLLSSLAIAKEKTHLNQIHDQKKIWSAQWQQTFSKLYQDEFFTHSWFSFSYVRMHPYLVDVKWGYTPMVREWTSSPDSFGFRDLQIALHYQHLNSTPNWLPFDLVNSSVYGLQLDLPTSIASFRSLWVTTRLSHGYQVEKDRFSVDLSHNLLKYFYRSSLRSDGSFFYDHIVLNHSMQFALQFFELADFSLYAKGGYQVRALYDYSHQWRMAYEWGATLTAQCRNIKGVDTEVFVSYVWKKSQREILVNLYDWVIPSEGWQFGLSLKV